MEHIELVMDGEDLLALIIRKEFTTAGIKFFTPDDFSQQLAYMHHKAGKKIKPHLHNRVKREVHFTQEVLVLKRGKLKVDIFRNDRSHLSTHTLRAGDVILLAGGGHGFEVLEDLEMIEVKQGPYSADMDKAHFEAQ